MHWLGSLQIMPGDILTVVGVFMPTPFTGFKAMRAGLITDTYLEVHDVKKMKKTYTYVLRRGTVTCDAVLGVNCCGVGTRD